MTEHQKKNNSLRIHQTVARDLGVAILKGAIAPGEVLSGEIEKSDEMGISRTAYREAIRILIAKGLVESRPRLGTRVTVATRWNLLDPDILTWMFSEGPNDDFVNDLFELRFVVEPAAAFLAAVRHSVEQVTAMREAVRQMQEYSLAQPEGRAADRRFHDLVLEASGNRALGTLVSSIGTAVEWTTYFKTLRQPEPRDSISDHVVVLEAIEARDGAAASEAMQNLIRNATHDMAHIVKPRDEGKIRTSTKS